MTKITTTVKPNGGSTKPAADVKKVIATTDNAAAEKAVKQVIAETVKPPAEKTAEPSQILSAKTLTILERISKVENLQLVVDKRAKLVQTRSELERFHTASNDFNCTMRLNDSDGNVFTTSFTPGIKKVIDFLKTSFNTSIADVEKMIEF